MAMPQRLVPYESEKMADKYLLFHYGHPTDQLPFAFGPHDALNFPVRCVTECLDIHALPSKAIALELGCSVGRSSFELSCYCDKVIAVDSSKRFIALAKRIQNGENIEYSILQEGSKIEKRFAHLPPFCFPERVEFQCYDVMDLPLDLGPFDVILAANLLCRLSNPELFLQRLAPWSFPSAQLIITSPYSWLEHYTPRKNWLGNNNKTTIENLQAILGEKFILQKILDLPFLMREHLRKYDWGVSQASLWLKKHH